VVECFKNASNYGLGVETLVVPASHDRASGEFCDCIQVQEYRQLKCSKHSRSGPLQYVNEYDLLQSSQERRHHFWNPSFPSPVRRLFLLRSCMRNDPILGPKMLPSAQQTTPSGWPKYHKTVEVHHIMLGARYQRLTSQTPPQKPQTEFSWHQHSHRLSSKEQT